MTICTVVATFNPTTENLKGVSEFLLEIAKEVRQEPGCEYYDLYLEVSGKLMFIEAWQSRELWEVHNNAPSVAKLRAFVEGKLLEPILIQEMYPA